MDDLSDANKAIIRSNIWDTLRPITRGLCIEVRYADEVYELASGWHHIGEEMRGFFPVIDFIKIVDKAEGG